MRKRDRKTSKFLSYILRHHPESIGLKLDQEGWLQISDLIHQARLHNHLLTYELIDHVVKTNNKQRFSLSADRKRIRANQGHSVPVNLNLDSTDPPKILFHGTATRFLDSIMSRGLQPGKRQYVHLSGDRVTATRVGQRHGKPIILVIEAQKMVRDGFTFYVSENGVWLTNIVPVRYINIPDNT